MRGRDVCQWLTFLVTSSRNIQFVTAGFVPNRKAGQLAKNLRKVLKLYAQGGFIVDVCHMDQ